MTHSIPSTQERMREAFNVGTVDVEAEAFNVSDPPSPLHPLIETDEHEQYEALELALELQQRAVILAKRGMQIILTDEQCSKNQ